MSYVSHPLWELALYLLAALLLYGSMTKIVDLLTQVLVTLQVILYWDTQVHMPCLQLGAGHPVFDSMEGVSFAHAILAAMHKQDWERQINQGRVSEVVLHGTAACTSSAGIDVSTSKTAFRATATSQCDHMLHLIVGSVQWV